MSILYALGRNGSAIIELHSILEREAIEKLARVIIVPEHIDIGRKSLERLTLQDLAFMLHDYGTLNRDDVKFAEKLSKLRNSVAHRNLKGVSNAVLSGQEIRDTELNAILAEVDYISYAIRAIRFLAKILDWDEDAFQDQKGGDAG